VNPYDIVLLVLMAGLALMGALWGVTRLAAGVVGFFVAFLLGLRLSGRGPGWFGGWIQSEEGARLAAFFLVFLGVMLLAAVTAFLLRRFLKKLLLGWADRAAGALVGALAGLLAGAALAVPLTALSPVDRPLLRDSVLAPYALGAADLIRHLVPDELAEEYREKREALKEAWLEGTRGESRDGP
jgi:uncharacterized membrane protein required for colicin V production